MHNDQDGLDVTFFLSRFLLKEEYLSLRMDGHVVPVNDVIAKFSKTRFLEKTDINQRGWVLDIINCVNQLGKKDFSLDEVYHFENELANLHPENNNIKAKIRQQLQVLRDKGFIHFKGDGSYSLV